MYYDFTVKIPSIKGKVTKRKIGNILYVYLEVSRVYDPKRKFNIPKRVVIGKVCKEDDTLMYPNDIYLKLFPDTVVPEERRQAPRSCCLRVGPYVVIDSIVNEYGLKPLLEKHLGDKAGLALDLASYMIVNEDNAGQYYPDYAFTHPLFTDQMRIYSDSSVSRFFSELKQDQIIRFLDDWNKDRDHRQRIYLSYDSTNKNCQAGDIDIVEFGNAKEDRGLPIVNVGLAYDSTNKVPLFYEQYSGSINDVSQFKCFVDKATEYNYRHIGFILDRGYFSQSNIRYMDKNGYQFVIMAKGCKDLVSAVVKEKAGTFETDRGGCIRYYHVYGTTVKKQLYPEDEHKRYFHIYFSASKMAAERMEVDNKIDRLENELKKYEGQEIEISDYCKHYFDCHYEGKKFLFAVARNEVIEEELKLCGYFCIITSEEMTAQEAFLLYKGRDASEKLFRADKTFLGARSLRIHSQDSMSAKHFIEFIALIIRNRIYNLLKEEMLRLGLKRNYMTVPGAIRELEKIEMVRRNNGIYRLDHAVTKTQRVILNSFGIDMATVKNKVSGIAVILQNAAEEETTEEKEEFDDDEEEINCFA